MKTKLVTLVAAGILGSTIAARAQAVAPDPNLAPTTNAEEARIAPTSPNSPRLAFAVDPNIGPSTTGQEALIAPTPADSPQLAVAPDPNLGGSSFGETAAMQAARTSGGATVAME
jgi:hypothetical protein